MQSLKENFLIKMNLMIVFQNCILVNEKLKENIDFPSL